MHDHRRTSPIRTNLSRFALAFSIFTSILLSTLSNLYAAASATQQHPNKTKPSVNNSVKNRQKKDLLVDLKLTFRIQVDQIALGEVTDSIVCRAGRYQIHSETQPAGIWALFPKAHIQRKSEGVCRDKQFWPANYSEQRGEEKPREAKIDYDRHQIWLDAAQNDTSKGFNDTSQNSSMAWPTDLSTPPGTKLKTPIADTLTAMYQWLLRDDFPEQYSLWVTDGLRLVEYRYAADGEESLTIPGAPGDSAQDQMTTTRKYHKIVTGDEPELTVWYASESRLPVKVRYRDHQGRIVEQILIRCEKKGEVGC